MRESPRRPRTEPSRTPSPEGTRNLRPENVESASPLLTRKEVAAHVQVTPTHITHLVKSEGLPCYPVNIGSRLHLRFRLPEVLAWLEERRARQLQALLDGTRYTRRREAAR